MKHWIQTSAMVLSLAVTAQVQATVITTGYEKSGTETTLVDDTSLQDAVVNGYTLDTIIAYAELTNSGDATEAGWMDAVFDEMGISIGDYSIDKIEFASDSDVDNFWTQVDGTVYNAEVTFDPEYYLLKIGSGQLDAEHFLYENKGDLGDLTIDLKWLDQYSNFTGNNFDIYRISHVTSTMAVPEPSILMLMGAGLIGFGIARRKRVQG